ncbi:gluconokinase [Jiella sonneratiae]|uniref:gluconokinase n=1 Tax=Jiella sonneratiae TaxID=2816856 RepID=UPI001FD912CF|nr:gluconokinase [Jiella sonneratiae]
MSDTAAAILVMGVCGVGKSTVGRTLAETIGRAFVEADDFHSSDNIETMRSGRPLDDAMRWSWLDAVAEAVAAVQSTDGGGPVVFACSALKRSYRDRLRERLGRIAIVHLTGSREVIGRRLSARRGHFMSPDLLQSQFGAMEEPDEAEEPCVTVDVGWTLQDLQEFAAGYARAAAPSNAAGP